MNFVTVEGAEYEVHHNHPQEYQADAVTGSDKRRVSQKPPT